MRRLVPVVLGVLLLSACLPEGFAEKPTQQALVLPTSLAFAPDGRLFVAEKRGTIHDVSPCPAQGRVARLTSGPGVRMTEQRVLVKDVCFEHQFHGGGDLRMAPDGSLLASFGEGSHYFDAGINGAFANACKDPGLRGS